MQSRSEIVSCETTHKEDILKCILDLKNDNMSQCFHVIMTQHLTDERITGKQIFETKKNANSTENINIYSSSSK